MIQLKNGLLARVSDENVYTRDGGSWTRVNTGTGFTKILQLQDGTFASIRTVYGVFTCPVINGTWSPIPNPVNHITDMIQLSNGTFACIANENVYTRECLHSGSWVCQEQ